MNQQALGTATAPMHASRVRVIPAVEIANRMKALHDAVASRAFEIFDGRGRSDGHALDDWFQAEAELFHTAHLDVSEIDDVVRIQAEVPGFHANELGICVEPRRLTITGKRQARNDHLKRTSIYADRCSNLLLRTFGLPFEVDHSKVTATLGGGILELSVPKVLSTSRIWLVPKTDWLVRAQDYRGWNEPLDAEGRQ